MLGPTPKGRSVREENKYRNAANLNAVVNNERLELTARVWRSSSTSIEQVVVEKLIIMHRLKCDSSKFGRLGRRCRHGNGLKNIVSAVRVLRKQ